MKTYRDFKQVNEADAANPLQDLEAQIDALFDELKQKLRSTVEPRQDWLSGLNSWYAKNKHRFEWSLLEYTAVTTYMEDLQEALTDPNTEAILDEYKEKLKQIVRTFMTQAAPAAAPKPPRKPRTPTVNPTAAPEAPMPATKVEPEAQPEAPTPAAKIEPEVPAKPTPPTAKVEPAPAPPTAKVEPAPAPPAAKVEPAAPTPPAAKPQESEEDKLMKLGAAIAFARDTEGDADPSDEDIEYALQQPLHADRHSPMRDAYIKMARDYLQKKAGQNLATSATPTKDQIVPPTTTEPPQAKGPMPAPAGAVTHPTREDLMAMTPKQFKAWMEEHDPELISAYEGMNWWTKSMRDELVGSYLTNRDFLSSKKESLQYKVNKYKELLRRENRPERLLSEAASLPFNERVNFYKKKLSSHDTFSTT